MQPRGQGHGVAFAHVLMVFACALAFAVVGLMVPGAPRADDAQCTDTWAGGAGSWDTAANWSTGAVPAAGDHVCLPADADVTISNNAQVADIQGDDAQLTSTGGTLVLSDAAATSHLQTFALRGGTLDGDGSLTIGTSFTWAGGEMRGAGTTTLASGATGALTLTSQGTLRGGRNFDNHGTLTWSGGSMWGAEGSTFVNEGTLHANSEDGFGFYNWFGSPKLINSGTIDKTDGTGTTNLGLGIDNRGQITVQTGALKFATGAAAPAGATGTWTAVSGASIELAGGTFQADHWQLSGTVRMTGGDAQIGDVQGDASLAITGGSFSVTDPATASHLRGLSIGGSGTQAGSGRLVVSDTFGWTGGSLLGDGETTLGSGVTGMLAFDVSGHLEHRTLVNHGTLTWSAGNMWGRDGGTFDNAGTLHANSEDSFGFYNWFGSPKFINSGTVDKTDGTGTTSISLETDNHGQVTARTGTLKFGSGAASPSGATGAWTATGAPSAAIELAGGAFRADHWQMSGVVRVTGGDHRVGDVQGDGDLAVSGGAFSVTDTATTSHVSALRMSSSGVQAGAGELDVADAFAWTGGSLLDDGRTVLGSGVTGTLAFDGSGHLEHRTLVNRGRLTWSSGNMWGRDGGTFDNEGTLYANSEDGFGFYNWTGTPRFLNGGTVAKTAGTGTTSISLRTENHGTISAATGRLVLGEGGASPAGSTGRWQTTGDGVVAIGGGAFAADHWAVDGDLRITGGDAAVGDVQGPSGSVAISGGSLSVTDTGTLSHLQALRLSDSGTQAGDGDLAVSDRLAWTGGSLLGTGRTVLETGLTGTLAFASSGHLEHRTLVNRGTLTWSDGNLWGRDGGTFDNEGTLYANSEDGFGIYNWTGAPRFLNAGTVTKTAGTGATLISLNFDNHGTVSASTGELRLLSGAASPAGATGTWQSSGSGWITLAGGAFSAGHWTVDGDLRVTGGDHAVADVDGPAGDLSVTGGTLHVTGTEQTAAPATARRMATAAVVLPSTLKSLDLDGGTLDNAADLTVAQQLKFNSGSLTGAGATSLPAGGVGTIDGTSQKTIQGQTLKIGGEVTWSRGSIWGRDGATIDNLSTGRFHTNSEDGLGLFPWTGRTEFINKGTVDKTDGGGRTRLGWPVENDNTVGVGSGELELSGGSTSEPSARTKWCPENGTVMYITGGTHLGDAELCPDGRFDIPGGGVTAHRLTGSGKVTLGGSLTLTDAAQASTLARLTVSNGTLDGPGSVTLTDALSWSGGTLSGSGTTTIAPGATGSIAPPSGSTVTLNGRGLVNDGQLTWASGSIWAANGAQIHNAGTLDANADGENLNWWYGNQPTLTNTGRIEKTAGTGSVNLALPFDNEGDVLAQGGGLRFTAGGIAATSTVLEPPADPDCRFTPVDPSHGSWRTLAGNNASIELGGGCWTLGGGTTLGGTVRVAGARVTLTNPAPTSGYTALDVASSGTLWLTTPSTLALSQLTLEGGLLNSVGTLDVGGTLDWTGGRLAGLGTLAIDPGATGEIHPPDGSGCADLDEQRVVNRGTLTWDGGCIDAGPGGSIENVGAWHMSSPSGTTRTMSTGSGENDLPILINTGDLFKDGAGRIMINVPAISTGRLQVNSGDIHFNDGDEDVTGDVEDGPEVTPDGHELTDHASEERQNEDPRIDLDLIDEVIERNEPEPQPNGRVRYYDPDENVTVITNARGDVIVTVFVGED
jgi:hypothetical protein